MWKWVIGLEGRYEISSIGNVRSYVGKGRKPSIQSIPHIIKPNKDGRGYFNFTINDGRKRVLLIHVEIAKTFIPNPLNYKLVRHLNDIKSDNRIDNLAWGDHALNMQDAIVNGKNPTYNNLGHGLIKFLYQSEHSCCSLANRYNISPSMVSKIKNGRSYAWLTKHKNKNFDL